ncbi:Helix-turn-helix domain protein [anaerobic digester metagenome]|nr:helix-turn-helix domain-containing protein [Clostridiaceae bacterium HFYG-1003]
MIESYNMKNFGEVVRTIRRSLNMTQKDVRDRVGISENALMKLEKGQVIPKYETLELLSLAYKIDLMALFLKYRYDTSLETIMVKADEAIINNQPQILQQCHEQYFEYLKSGDHRDLINSSDLDLLECFLANAAKYYHHNLKDFQIQAMIENIRATLQRVNPDMKWHKLDKGRFNLWEIRLLILLALLEGNLDHYDVSIRILESIYLRFKSLRKQVVREQKVFLIALFNLSYHYHVTDQFDKALEIAEAGIDYAKETSDFTLLHALYYRKGIAQYLLGQANYLDALRFAVTMLEIQDKQEMAKLYRTVSKDNYQIEIP